MSGLEEPGILFSLSLESPDYIGRHLDALRRFAAAHPVEAGLIINALVGGMVQSNAHAFMRGLASEPPRSLRPEPGGEAPGQRGEEPRSQRPAARIDPGPARPNREFEFTFEPAPERPAERPSDRVFERAPERFTGPQEALGTRTTRSTPPRPSEAPFSAQLISASEAPAAVGHTFSPPAGAPEPPELAVGDQVQHRWLGVGVVERIWWRDDHWHVATDRFGAPASRLKKVGGR